MAYAPKDGSGALFKNTQKAKDTHPDYKGDAMVNGKHMEIAAWIKEGKNGKFMSLSFKPKSGDPEPRHDARDLDDSIPY